MFLDRTYSMSMKIPMAPESMRASTKIGVLLSTVLSCKGISVPLWSMAEHTGKGSSESWGVDCSGTTCSVLRSVRGDGMVDISFVDPTVLASSTENLLV